MPDKRGHVATGICDKMAADLESIRQFLDVFSVSNELDGDSK